MSNDADMKTYNICSGLRNSLACNVNLEITSDVIKDLKFEDKDKDFARGQQQTMAYLLTYIRN